MDSLGLGILMKSIRGVLSCGLEFAYKQHIHTQICIFKYTHVYVNMLIYVRLCAYVYIYIYNMHACTRKQSQWHALTPEVQGHWSWSPALAFTGIRCWSWTSKARPAVFHGTIILYGMIQCDVVRYTLIQYMIVPKMNTSLKISISMMCMSFLTPHLRSPALHKASVGLRKLSQRNPWCCRVIKPVMLPPQVCTRHSSCWAEFALLCSL